MTIVEYALHRGVTGSYIRRMRRHGNLVMSGDDLILVRESDELLNGLTHPVRGGKRPGSGRPSAAGKHRDLAATAAPPAAPLNAAPETAGVFQANSPSPGAHSADPGAERITVQEAVRRERLARARLAEIELGEQARQLTRVDQVNRAVFTLVRQALNQLQGMSARLAKPIAAESDAFRVGLMIDADVANICAEMRAAAARLLDPSASAPEPADDVDDAADADLESEALPE